MPVANDALLVLFIVSIVLFVVAAFGLAFPKPFCRMLVALRLLKWQDGGLLKDVSILGASESSSKPVKKLKALCGKVWTTAKKVQAKYWIFAGCALAFILILIFGVRGCSTGSVFGGAQALTDDLTEQASFYISAQKSYFAKNKAVGGPKALQMPDSLLTDYFTYRVSASRFSATLNKNIKDCPAGSRWTVNASTKGFFTVDLVLSRVAPKDSNCTFIAPNFKNLGKK